MEGRRTHLSPWLVTLLGMGTVFVGLIGLVYITKLMSFFISKLEGIPRTKKTPEVAAPVLATSAATIVNRKEFDAVVAAAIATYIGSNISGLRIRSVRRLSEPHADRMQFTAAISAAIAATMGTNVSGLRIHSIKKI